MIFEKYLRVTPTTCSSKVFSAQLEQWIADFERHDDYENNLQAHQLGIRVRFYNRRA